MGIPLDEATTTRPALPERYPSCHGGAKCQGRGGTRVRGRRCGERGTQPRGCVPRGAPKCLELRAQGEVVLASIAVERARLRGVQRVVLEGRVVQVLAIKVDAEVVVEDPRQRGRQGTDRVLREGRLAIQAAVERGAVVVRNARAEVRTLE